MTEVAQKDGRFENLFQESQARNPGFLTGLKMIKKFITAPRPPGKRVSHTICELTYYIK